MSNLKSHLNNYLVLRHMLGYKLKETETLLNKFIDFLDSRNSQTITLDLAMEWALLPKHVQPSNWSKRLSVIRLFSRYLIAYIPETEIPDPALLYSKAKRAIPYLYSDNQIKKILNTCLSEKSKGLRHLTYYTFFGLLAVTGCRISEAVNLSINDVNPKKRTIVIRGSKFGKSRELPLSITTNDRLIAYLKQRSFFALPCVDNYFISEKGEPLTANGVEIFYVRLSKKIGLRCKDDSFGPRIHDFRHSFAIKSFINCYKDNGNVHQILPLLATYLGHRKPSDTYWYLTNVPELMALAAVRLEKSGVLL